jgi:linoleoyl-CoA desaturase
VLADPACFSIFITFPFLLYLFVCIYIVNLQIKRFKPKMEKPITFTGPQTDFPVALRKRVDEYFKANNIRQTGNWKLFSKTIILLSACVASYCLVVFGNLPLLAMLGLSVVFGVVNAGIGFGVMHDGAHGSYSQKPWLNNLMGYTLNLMGGSVFFWKIKHNVVHHNVTNIEGHDDDINLRPLMRTCEHQPYSKGHRFQHIYGLFLYGFTVIWWIFVRDFMKYFSGRIASKEIGKIPVSEHVIFWFTKAYYGVVFFALPIYMMGAGPALLFYFTSSFVMGFVLAIVFQLAHVVETTEFPMPENSANKIEHDWFYHQFATTANFATENPLITWYTGGLNFQVEHHLFPRISHVHYPALRNIVKQLCAEYKVPYNEYPTMASAINSHFSFLKELGKGKMPAKKKETIREEELVAV